MSNQINLYSTTLYKSVKPRLKELIKQAECLQMSVAYWTINKNYFYFSDKEDNYLVNLLTKKDSFACIDISLPTNVSNVCEIAAQTDTLYFYTRSFSKVNSQGQTPHMVNHLLHSKILLFDLPNEQASIWIGSHNWTDRALSGINIETSLEILVNRNDKIYKEVKQLLADIKNQCHKVNPQLEKVYKNIQKQEDTWLYCELGLDEKNNIYTDLATNKKIILHLFFNKDNPPNIDNRRRIFLFLRDSTISNSGCLFKGNIARSGQLPRSQPKLSFPDLDEGYYCFQKDDDGFTNLKYYIKNLSQEDKNKYCYYATIVAEFEKTIASIEEFFSDYEPVITVNGRSMTLKILSDDSLFLIEKIVTIEEPIDNDSVDEYMSEITSGKIAKVTKKKETD